MKFLTVVLCLLPAVAWSCPKGSTEYEGVCAIELMPADSAKGVNTSWVSDEKPPKTTTGEWQTGAFKIIQINSQTIDDEIASKKAEDKRLGINDDAPRPQL